MEDALGAAERDGGRQEGAADGDQPAGARIGAPQPRHGEQPEAADEREAEQPAALAAEALVQQPQQARLAAEHAAAAGAAGTPSPAGSAVLAEQAPEPVVAEDERPDAVVARPRDPRPAGRRREPYEHRPRQADGCHRGAAGEQLADGGDAPAGSDPQPRRGERGRDQQGRRHLRLEAQADEDAAQHQPARPSVLQAAHDRPQRGGAAQHQQGVGVVVARDRDGDRRQRECQAGREAGDPAESPPRQVIGRARRSPRPSGPAARACSTC